MKLPRWLVTSMLSLSALATLAAVGWSWATWPERTASRFIALVSGGNSEAAEDLLTGDSEVSSHWNRITDKLVAPKRLSDGADVAGAEGEPQSNPSFK